MRTELKKLNKQRLTIIATVEGFGQKSSFRGPPLKTILFTDIQSPDGKNLTDHLWFTDGFWSKDLKPGDKVQLDARVTPYEKGYNGQNIEHMLENPISTDYKLSHPTKVKILNK